MGPPDLRLFFSVSSPFYDSVSKPFIELRVEEMSDATNSQFIRYIINGCKP